MTRMQHMPAVALRGLTVIPGMVIHFDLSREKSINACNKAMTNKNNNIFLIAQKDINIDEPAIDDLYHVGTIAKIRQLTKMPNGKTTRVLVEGIERASLEELGEEGEYLIAGIRVVKDTNEAVEIHVKGESEEESATRDEAIHLLGEAELREMQSLFGQYAVFYPRVAKSQVGRIKQIQDLAKLIDEIIGNIPVHYEHKQAVLESTDLSERYLILCQILTNEIEVAKVRGELSKQLQSRVDKHQKEYLLREQLHFIRQELGEENTQSDAEEYLEKLAGLEASEEIKARIKKEILRFQNMSSHSSENAMERSYIETLLEMPWDRCSKDSNDIRKAERILERDHYGLEKVKERILEFLAVRALWENEAKKKAKDAAQQEDKKTDRNVKNSDDVGTIKTDSESISPIICLVGPPGTGKTSIARSVAESLNKKYVRISLGGVRDEAEIRGHRRTYVGSMPGRIVNGLRQAGVNNPLMLLDEIDKAGTDSRGDTASALLEVLDSEQNVAFRDHYVEIPVDLSQVLFLATANDAANIPRPLRDRMELIEVNSYTSNEKLHIAKKYLLPKQLKKHGLTKGQLKISPQALNSIIDGYTKEAGVRGLERTIGQICRKAARRILEDEKAEVKVTPANLEEFLGKIKYRMDKKNDEDMVGIVRGLAWTSVGGDTLEIEVNIMPGKGDISLTGQMGDVMKESAAAGISYIRSVADDYRIPKTAFSKQDIHIHIPEGAVPKDGPSAGITMATAVISALTDRKVHANLAMTGEITLRGRVLPIGGLKEKLLAAKTAGITKVLVPIDNKKDVEEISSEITDGIEIVFVSTMNEVLKHALVR